MFVPTYSVWREAYVRWAGRHPSKHAAATEMAARIAANGDSASVFTLRYHLEGRFTDAKLRLAHSVWTVLEEDRAGQ